MNVNRLSPEESRRYSRQTAISGVGEQGQLRLKNGKVFVVGCGALGSMIAMQLAAAGVGMIAIADFDTVDISNLQRQFFYKTADAGRLKADVLYEEISGINPLCEVRKIVEMINAEKGRNLFKGYDFVMDATDNPDSKRMLETVCEELGIVCCIAGVSGFSGQVMTVYPGDVKFNEVFSPEGGMDFLPCSAGGVSGPAAALCASLQASECIKYLTGHGECLKSRMLTFNLADNTFHRFEI